MKTITANTAGGAFAVRVAISGGLLAMSLLAGCGNKGPLVKPSDIPPPAAMPSPEAPAPATPAPDASMPAAPAPEAPAVPAPGAAPVPATPASGAG